MNAKILNRDFQHPADGWYQIEPKGDHPNRAAGVVQVIDADAVTSIVNRFNSDAAAGLLRHGSEMLIDHEHFSDQPDQESRAYGWLQELQNRDDGIYGRLRWTTTGKAAVDGGDYRFFSTEYAPADLKVLNSHPTKRVRPLKLDGLSLTNMNNNRGQKPITNRGPNNFPGSRESVDSTDKTNTPNKMKNLMTAMGLSADASEESAVEAFHKIKNRNTELEPLAAENITLKNRIAQFDGEQVDGLLELHGVKEEKIKNRLKPVLAAMKTREDRVAALADFGFKPVEAAKTVRVINRQTAPATPQGGTTPPEVTPAIINNEVRKIMNRDGIKDYTTAFNALAAERPELFAKPNENAS